MDGYMLCNMDRNEGETIPCGRVRPIVSISLQDSKCTMSWGESESGEKQLKLEWEE